MKKLWFKARDYGTGWSPNSWQGWLIIAAWTGINLWWFMLSLPGSSSTSDALIDSAPFFLLTTLVLHLMCWKTGEKPQWRWRGHVVPKEVVWRKAFQLLLFIALAELVGILGTVFTFDAIPNWYATLAKPSFAPPNWLFGPVWTLLYAMMGTAAFFAWDLRFEKTHAERGMNWYWVQLFLNGIWTPIFFGAKNIGLALIVIALLWGAIVMTMREFAKVNSWLAILLLPYLLWVSFATILNYTLWTLN